MVQFHSLGISTCHRCSQKTKTKTLKIELLYDPAIPLLVTYLEKIILQKDTCNPMFIAALFTIAKTWKHCKCPSKNEWIKKMWYISTVECYSAIKKEWNNAICRNMDGPGCYHTKWSNPEKGKYLNITYMWNLKEGYKQTNLQNRNKLTDIKNKLMITKEEGGEG